MDDIDDILSSFDSQVLPTGIQDLNDLTKHWIAERGAPEILPFQEALVDRIMQRIRQQVYHPSVRGTGCGSRANVCRKIEIVEAETGDLDPQANFRLIIIQTELERVKYLVRAYLRARIAKVPPSPTTPPTTNHH